MSYELLKTIHDPGDLKALPSEKLEELAGEVRQAICDQVSKTGGHLAPNLGVVELTIALHRVFDFGPIGAGREDFLDGDRLLFDVGHQCYPHKLLTGRLGMLGQLRTRQGMAGFPEPRESDYDLFSVGHAGTAISTAVGMARGDALLAERRGVRAPRSVAVVGDASIVNGVALEGLNNAGTLDRQMLVVLNDNGMSIAKPQGAMARYFDHVRVSETYKGLKATGKKIMAQLPGGSLAREAAHRWTESVKAMLLPEHLFESFGLVCLGPVDGHDLDELTTILEEVKDIDRPVLLHVKTVKGKGFEYTEADPTALHSPKPFVVNGCRVEHESAGRSFTAAFADGLADVMKRDEDVFAITAAMPDGTGVAKLMPAFPERTLDTGICESHAMDMCAGMAKSGLKPFFAVYSTFTQRAIDQLFQEVALQGLPVRVCMDRAGFVGGDGAVHHGFMDITMLRALPNVVMLAPCDEVTLKAGLEFMRGYDDAASLMRYPRDNVATEPLQDEDACPAFELGRANLVKITDKSAKPDLAILAYGTMVYQAAAAMEQLEAQGHRVALYDARFALPVDIELIGSLVAQGIPLLTVEDHALSGGFGSVVLEALSDRGLPTHGVHRLGMPRRWVYQDSRSNQLKEAGLDARSIARSASRWLRRGREGESAKTGPVGGVV
ncbi:MAG: 1-deoxy-D-xylulose-5-phosphate synthase [Planctomycetota bacterium]